MAITVTDYQPDDTIAIDTFIFEGAPTTNLGTDTTLRCGPYWTGATKGSILIRFDWMWNGNGGSNCPKSKKFKLTSDVKLDLYTISIGSGGSAYFPEIQYLKRDWVEGEVTWNQWKTGSNWSTAGAIHADDSLDTGYKHYGVAAGAWWTFYVPAGLIIQSIAGQYFGLLIKDYGLGNYTSICASSSNATAANRPKYSFSYEPYHKIYMVKSGLGQT